LSKKGNFFKGSTYFVILTAIFDKTAEFSIVFSKMTECFFIFLKKFVGE